MEAFLDSLVFVLSDLTGRAPELIRSWMRDGAVAGGSVAGAWLARRLRPLAWKATKELCLASWVIATMPVWLPYRLYRVVVPVKAPSPFAQAVLAWLERAPLELSGDSIVTDGMYYANEDGDFAGGVAPVNGAIIWDSGLPRPRLRRFERRLIASAVAPILRRSREARDWVETQRADAEAADLARRLRGEDTRKTQTAPVVPRVAVGESREAHSAPGEFDIVVEDREADVCDCEKPAEKPNVFEGCRFEATTPAGVPVNPPGPACGHPAFQATCHWCHKHRWEQAQDRPTQDCPRCKLLKGMCGPCLEARAKTAPPAVPAANTPTPGCQRCERFGAACVRCLNERLLAAKG